MSNAIRIILLWLVCVGMAIAQSFPSKPLRMIVQYPAGGAIDGLARNVAQQAMEAIGQPVVVDNRPGASGLIAMEACAKAPPDGYTMCLATGEAMSFNPSLFAKLPYDPDRDFIPFVHLVRIEGVIVASAGAPFDTVPEMIAAAKAKPGVINWASFGQASNAHIYLEWIRKQSGADITHVPYKGSAQTLPALLTNEAQVTYVALGFVLPQIRAGKLKALAVTTPKRLALLPQVPTLNELGMDPGFDSWVGLMVPAGTPAAVVDRLNAIFAKAVREPALRDKFLAAQAFEPVGSTSAAFAEMIRGDRAVARRVVQSTGITLEPGLAK